MNGPSKFHPGNPGHELNDEAWLMSAIQTVPPTPTVMVFAWLSEPLVPVTVAVNVPRVEPETESVEVAVP